MIRRALQPLRRVLQQPQYRNPPIGRCSACGERLLSSSFAQSRPLLTRRGAEVGDVKGKGGQILVGPSKLLRRRGELVLAPTRTASLSTSQPGTRDSSPLASTSNSSNQLHPSQALIIESCTTISDLEDAISSGSSLTSRATFNALSPSCRATLPRSTFDSLFAVLTEKHEPRRRIRRIFSALKALRSYAIDERNWELTDEEIRDVFEAGVRWEELRPDFPRKSPSRNGDSVEVWDTPERERARQDYLDGVMGDLLIVKERSRSLVERDRKTIDRYALVVFGRGAEFLDRAADIYAFGAQISINDTISIPAMSDVSASPSPMVSSTASAILVELFRVESTKAVGHLNVMLDRGHLPSTQAVKSIVLEMDTSTTPVDPYTRARQVLDDACDSNGQSAISNLDALLAERLAQLDKIEEAQERPWFAFLKWLAGDRAEKALSMDQWLLTALRTWEAVFGHGSAPIRYDSIELLDELIKRVLPQRNQEVNVEHPAPSAYFSSAAHRPSPSAPTPAVVKAIRLALEHLTVKMLVERSVRMLQAITVTSIDRVLAREVYLKLRERAPLGGTFSFKWSAALRPTLVHLVILASSKSAPDPQLIIHLYLDWTAVGMTWPKTLYSPLWRALGVQGNIEDLARVIEDFEATGRGRVEDRIISLVLEASASTIHISSTLQLLDYFRDRSPIHSTRPEHLVPLRTYERIFWQLASSQRDRRSDLTVLFRHAVEQERWKPRTTTWNAVLASHVFRPKFLVEDLKTAGKAYDTLIGQAKNKPDAMTFSLLLHGFLRMSNEIKGKESVGLEAGLKTCATASDRGFLLRGQQVAGLVLLLGRTKRFEEAKGVSEDWWKLALKHERAGGRTGEDSEMVVMRRAKGVVDDWESRAEVRGVGKALVGVGSMNGMEQSEISELEEEVSARSFPPWKETRRY